MKITLSYTVTNSSYNNSIGTNYILSLEDFNKMKKSFNINVENVCNLEEGMTEIEVGIVERKPRTTYQDIREKNRQSSIQDFFSRSVLEAQRKNERLTQPISSIVEENESEGEIVEYSTLFNTMPKSMEDEGISYELEEIDAEFVDSEGNPIDDFCSTQKPVPAIIIRTDIQTPTEEIINSELVLEEDNPQDEDLAPKVIEETNQKVILHENKPLDTIYDDKKIEELKQLSLPLEEIKKEFEVEDHSQDLEKEIPLENPITKPFADNFKPIKRVKFDDGSVGVISKKVTKKEELSSDDLFEPDGNINFEDEPEENPYDYLEDKYEEEDIKNYYKSSSKEE